MCVYYLGLKFVYFIIVLYYIRWIFRYILYIFNCIVYMYFELEFKLSVIYDYIFMIYKVGFVFLSVNCDKFWFSVSIGCLFIDIK